MTMYQEPISLERTIKTRKEWIDSLRGFGIILMIIGHTFVCSPIIVWIYGFHMPLFFILSGYLYNEQKWSKAGYKVFLFSRWKNYIIPYFLWCGICFIINLPLLWNSHRNNLLSALLQNLGWILTSIRVDGIFLPQNCTALWFLTCLFLSQQIFYWVIKCKPIMQCIISLVFIAINYALNYLSIPLMPWHLDVSLIGSVFMLVGYYFKDKQLLDKIKNPYIYIFIFFISTAIIMLNGQTDIYYRQYGFDLIVFIIGAIMMCFIFMRLFKSMKTVCSLRVSINLGYYSIIAMALNYSINSFYRLIYMSVSSIMGINLSWIEYPLTITNILLCMLFISIYQSLEKKNHRISILLGR